jgi:phosphoribosyl 1,2-cyclic phosphodiesterase
MSLLNFIGIGSAFNTELGNTSAFFVRDNNLFLIDCGCDVFNKLKEKYFSILSSSKNIYVFITHVHDDHIGSLSSLILYIYYTFNKKVIIIHNGQYDLMKILNLQMGYNQEYFNEINISLNQNIIIDSLNYKTEVIYRKTNHVYYLKSFGLIISICEKNIGKQQIIYYSGDSNFIPKHIINNFKNELIDYIYQDTCGLNYEDNPHMYIEELEKIIPIEYRHRVYCMHLDNKITKYIIESKGFKVPEIYKG